MDDEDEAVIRGIPPRQETKDEEAVYRASRGVAVESLLRFSCALRMTVILSQMTPEELQDLLESMDTPAGVRVEICQKIECRKKKNETTRNYTLDYSAVIS